MSASRTGNHFLDHLSPEVAAALQSHMRHIELPQGTILFRAGDIIRRVIFPVTGAISLVVPLAGGQGVEACMVGRNGLIGSFAAFGVTKSVNQAVIQIAGAGLAIDAAILKRLADEDSGLRKALVLWKQMLFVQLQQIAACNALHGLEARLSRWIAHARDLVESDTLPLTHESLSQMLAVQRSSVTSIVHRLHELAVIRARRGAIDVLDPNRLQSSACECYRTINDQFRQIIGWNPSYTSSFGKGAEVPGH